MVDQQIEVAEAGDRRVQRTQAALRSALITLTLARGYGTLTIRDLTEAAGIGYATFFRHYADKDALLLAVLDSTLTELVGALTAAAEADATAVGTRLFAYVAAHHEVCQVLLRARSSTGLEARIVAAGAANVLRHNQARPGAPVPAELAAHHLVTATMTLIAWWLDQGMPYPAARMGAIYAALIEQPTRALAF